MIPSEDFSVLKRESVLDLGFLGVTKRTIKGPDGGAFDRIVVEHPGAVAVVPIIGTDVVLLRQYRAAAGDRILEIPAGKLDIAGEDLEEAARRELEEEAGLTGGTITKLTSIWTSVGFSDERITIFMIEEPSDGLRSPVGPEETDAEVVRMPLTEAVSLVASGVVSDAKTVAGILLAIHHRDAS
ncbi:MAG: NUDIX hydrolase [Actinomycetota bacterium]